MKRKQMGDAQNYAETRTEFTWETHRIMQKSAQNCAESDLGPDFIGTFVPNLGPMDLLLIDPARRWGH
jgi:hypothetical protein